MFRAKIAVGRRQELVWNSSLQDANECRATLGCVGIFPLLPECLRPRKLRRKSTPFRVRSCTLCILFRLRYHRFVRIFTSPNRYRAVDETLDLQLQFCLTVVSATELRLDSTEMGDHFQFQMRTKKLVPSRSSDRVSWQPQRRFSGLTGHVPFPTSSPRSRQKNKPIARVSWVPL
jgi:hypothetical protein